MKSVLLIIASLIVLSSCTDSNNEINECLTDKTEVFKKENQDRGFTFIYTFEQDGMTYTIFDSGIAFDATAEVVDDNCNVVCTYGGFRMVGDIDERCDQYQEGINRAVITWEGGS